MTAPRPYARPWICVVIYIVAAVACFFGIVALSAASTESVVLLCGSFALIFWGQMIEYIARAAHFAEESANILGAMARATATPVAPVERLAPPPSAVYPEQAFQPPAIDADVRRARQIAQDAKSLYGRNERE